jgi:hypothetical protein
MAVVRTKGMKLQLTIATVLTDITQVIGFTVGESAPETYEADYLSNTGASILMENTGRVSVPTITGELFFSGDEASHEFLVDTNAVPPTSAIAGKLIPISGTKKEVTFNCIGVGLGYAVALGDGLKAPFTLALSGIPVYPS